LDAHYGAKPSAAKAAPRKTKKVMAKA
jgi:hypothetical protein